MFVCSIAPSFGNDWNAQKLKRLHQTYLSILLERAERQNYVNLIIKEKHSVNYLHYLQKLNNLLIKKAFSSDDATYCSYGGWPTPKNKKGECYAPWDYQTRNDEFFQRFGYRYKSCGGQNKFRCHPLAFYVPGELDGICVENVDDKKPSDLMKACMDKHKQHQDEFVEYLLSNQKALSQYLALAGESLRFCEQEGASYSSCREYSDRLKDHAALTMTCNFNQDLFVNLPGLITEANRNYVDGLGGSGLATDFLDYMEKLDEEQSKVESYNRKIIKMYVDFYSSSTKTKNMINSIKENANECLERSCYYYNEEGKRVYRRGAYWDKKSKSLKKNPQSSMEKCYRYVKYGIVDGGYHDNKWEIGGTSAVKAGVHLEKLGFKNIYNANKNKNEDEITKETSLENAFPELNAHNAPVGSILVYKSLYGSASMHGHIEVKLADSGDYQYGSDYLTDEPITDVLSSRKLIGIYVKIPEVEEMQGIIKVPQVGDLLNTQELREPSSVIELLTPKKKKKDSK